MAVSRALPTQQWWGSHPRSSGISPHLASSLGAARGPWELGPPWGTSDVSPLPPWPPALLDRHSCACGYRWAQHLLGVPKGTLTLSVGNHQVW